MLHENCITKLYLLWGVKNDWPAVMSTHLFQTGSLTQHNPFLYYTAHVSISLFPCAHLFHDESSYTSMSLMIISLVWKGSRHGTSCVPIYWCIALHKHPVHTRGKSVWKCYKHCMKFTVYTVANILQFVRERVIHSLGKYLPLPGIVKVLISPLSKLLWNATLTSHSISSKC